MTYKARYYDIHLKGTGWATLNADNIEEAEEDALSYKKAGESVRIFKDGSYLESYYDGIGWVGYDIPF